MFFDNAFKDESANKNGEVRWRPKRGRSFPSVVEV